VRWHVPAIFLVGLGLFSFGQMTAPAAGMWTRLTVLGVVTFLAAVWVLSVRRRDIWWPHLRKILEAHTDVLDGLPERQLGWWIGLASGVGLFVELMIIRWHASTFQLFAYYKNVSLLAAFLGLGIGYAMGRRRPVMTPLVLPALGLQFVVMYYLRNSRIQGQLQNPVSEQLAFDLPNVSTLSHLTISYGFLILVFGFTVLTCIPLGHLASRLMLRRPALVAYGWNLLGSLVGIGLFSLLSYAWTPPSVWLIMATLGIIPFLAHSALMIIPSLLVVGSALTILITPSRTNLVDVYSPYQILSLRMEQGRLPWLQVNHVYYQRILDLSRQAQDNNPSVKKVADYYELPYWFKPRAEQVLVVGSGMGNDVAAGLRQQAGRIDAVEIDPVILNYGRTLHPERPYSDRRLEAILDDARNFIRRTDRRYDLIVYGLLDSHTLLSGMSNVRLDSFVYTVEAFREARARLTSNGVIAMTFSLLSKQVGRKLFLMLREAFDEQNPRVFQTEYDDGYMFVIGPGLPSSVVRWDLPVREVTTEFSSDTIRADVSTDDWPFLYMPVRTYPISYVVMVSVLIAISLLALRQFMPLAIGRFSPVCFFLGAGFMLVETKGITELGLTYGNTWHVVSFVIAGILIMAFLANMLIMRLGMPHPAVTYGLLGGVLLLGMTVSGASLAGLPPAMEKILATTLVTSPLFFSGFAFSGELDRFGDISGALSSNLLGAMLGGFLEYNSMYFGFRSLYVFALALYGLALVSSLRARG
jgi:hypothetical protein